jgi:RNA polymerase sigma-70 factor (ECF subfamily)
MVAPWSVLPMASTRDRLEPARPERARAQPAAPSRPALGGRARQRFATTRWSLVTQAAEPGGVAALSELCRAYWSPVHAFIQGHGVSAEDAADVTQEFFETLLARNDLARADRTRGQFRSWLRTCARNHLYNWFARRRGLRVGGRAVHVSVDAAEGLAEASLDTQDAERMYDRRWAQTVIDRALGRLEQRYLRADKRELFARLQVGLSGAPSDGSDRQLSLVLGKSVGAIKVERHRMRKRFLECLKVEVAETVSDLSEIDAELRRLLEALS